MMTHDLSGLNNIHILNLTGRPTTNNAPSINYQINFLKTQIVSDYIVPLFSKQWDVLSQNMCFIDHLDKKLCGFYKKYKLNELLVYSELLKVLRVLLDKHNLLEEMETKTTNKGDPTQIVNMIYKTTMIRLLPEYEIYNSVIGKPNRRLNETYNETIIADITKLLTQERITFAKMKDILEHKYKSC